MDGDTVYSVPPAPPAWPQGTPCSSPGCCQLSCSIFHPTTRFEGLLIAEAGAGLHCLEEGMVPGMGCPWGFSGSEQVTSPTLDPAGKGMWLRCVAKKRGWNGVPLAVFPPLLNQLLDLAIRGACLVPPGAPGQGQGRMHPLDRSLSALLGTLEAPRPW